MKINKPVSPSGRAKQILNDIETLKIRSRVLENQLNAMLAAMEDQEAVLNLNVHRVNTIAEIIVAKTEEAE